MSPSPGLTHRACCQTTPRSAYRLSRSIPSSPVFRTALRPLISYPCGYVLYAEHFLSRRCRGLKDGKSAYALLNQNDTLTKINLTVKPRSRLSRSASATRRTAS